MSGTAFCQSWYGSCFGLESGGGPEDGAYAFEGGGPDGGAYACWWDGGGPDGAEKAPDGGGPVGDANGLLELKFV